MEFGEVLYGLKIDPAGAELEPGIRIRLKRTDQHVDEEEEEEY